MTNSLFNVALNEKSKFPLIEKFRLALVKYYDDFCKYS